MSNLLHFFIVTFFILVSSFLISCSTLPEGCIKYTAFEVCEQTYSDTVKCHKDGKEKISLSKSEWEEKKAGRMSLQTTDVDSIKEKLEILEALTCDE